MHARKICYYKKKIELDVLNTHAQDHRTTSAKAMKARK